MAIFRVEQFRRSFPLRGQEVELLLFGEEHINKQYLGWLNDPKVVRYSNQRFRQHDEASSLAYLQSFQGGGNLFLAIYLPRSGKFVGTMTAYFSIPHETADMGILIGDRNSWGQGVGKDAWSTLMSLLLESGKVRKVTGGALRCNVGMVNVMLKTGMSPDGLRIGQELVEGVPQDVLHFARFRNE
jgi:[ribosomal protein S5]-alanine N-acetyltransferase